jgi:hypothetical protein
VGRTVGTRPRASRVSELRLTLFTHDATWTHCVEFDSVFADGTRAWRSTFMPLTFVEDLIAKGFIELTRRLTISERRSQVTAPVCSPAR